MSTGYAHEAYTPLERSGWRRIEIETVASVSPARSRRVECLWVSPAKDLATPRRNVEIGLVSDDEELTNRQRAAYRTHQIRTEESEALIVESIRILARLGKKVTKAEVARMTGLSRVHIFSQLLFDCFSFLMCLLTCVE